jgi:hypothetical protein
LVKQAEKSVGVQLSADDVLAVETETGLVLFYERNEDKGKRNRATFFTLDIHTGEKEELFQNPLAVQEIDGDSMFY